MNETQNKTIPMVGHPTIIDEFIEALIQNTADGLQHWRTDMSGPTFRYSFDTGQGTRIYITQDWINNESVMFSLHMVSNANPERDTLIASEHTPHDEENNLRQLFLAAQDHITDDELDVLGYAKRYTHEVKQRNTFDELCRILVTESEDIIELFQTKESL